MAELMRLGGITEFAAEPGALLRYLEEIAEAADALGTEIDPSAPVRFDPDPERAS